MFVEPLYLKRRHTICYSEVVDYQTSRTFPNLTGFNKFNNNMQLPIIKEDNLDDSDNLFFK